MKIKVLILLFSLCSQGIALAQKLITYSVNERDSSLYRSTEYEFKKLSISNARLDLYTIICRALLGDVCYQIQPPA